MQRVKIELIDDLDGTVIGDGGGTFRFGVDGESYELDLSSANAARLREALQPYLEVARKAVPEPSRPAAPRRAPRQDARAVREWARANGIELDARGRIPSEVRLAYESRTTRPN